MLMMGRLANVAYLSIFFLALSLCTLFVCTLSHWILRCWRSSFSSLPIFPFGGWWWHYFLFFGVFFQCRVLCVFAAFCHGFQWLQSSKFVMHKHKERHELTLKSHKATRRAIFFHHSELPSDIKYNFIRHLFNRLKRMLPTLPLLLFRPLSLHFVSITIYY